MHKLPRGRVPRFCYLLLHRYARHNVAIESAALAFYLLFMIFPFLIFISALLGLLKLDVTAILLFIRDILPQEAVDFVEMYLTYVAANSNTRLLVFGLVFSIYFPMRATNSLLLSVRTAYHLGQPRSAIAHWLKTLLYTVLLILSIALTLALMTLGERALWYAVEHFRLPALAAALWVKLRFPAAALVGYFALFLLYAMAQDIRQPWRNLWPGTLAALAAWLCISWVYAYYVDHFAHYASLYGSIGAVIVVLIWLNLSAVTLMMGAEFNGVLAAQRKERTENRADTIHENTKNKAGKGREQDAGRDAEKV